VQKARRTAPVGPTLRGMTSPDDPFAAPQGPSLSKDTPPDARQPLYGPPPGYASPPSYGPPPGYGAPGYGPPPLPGQVPPPYWQPAPQTSGTAIAALVLAVGSFVVLPLIPAIIALVLARSASQDIRAAGGRLTGEGLLTAARWTAWINIALCVGAVALVVLFLGLFSAAAVSA
jgi:hypothetical protein